MDIGLEKRIEEGKRKHHINQQGLICHASYFNNIQYILEKGLTAMHPERKDSMLPAGINITLMGYLIEQMDAPFPAVASFELEKGEGVVLLGRPANTHVPKQYRQFASDERPVFSLFDVPDDECISFHCRGLQYELTSKELKDHNYQERNENMTGMIISSPDIKREWLRGFVIPPSCYIHPTPQTKKAIEERTLDFIDMGDSRIRLIESESGKSYLIPQEVLVKSVVNAMDDTSTSKANHVPLYDIGGNCLYRSQD